jgi:hypothetical protein
MFIKIFFMPSLCLNFLLLKFRLIKGDFFMGRKKTYIKRKFESTGESSDTSANIYMSMLMSEAWRELSAKQQQLYLYCKAQYYAEKKKPINDNNTSFTMNQSKWHELYGLYSLYNKTSFYRDMTALIEKGFVRCLQCGAIMREKTIYEFSDKWQLYGTAGFKILPSEMTITMLRKYRASKQK